jgi:hypothetical protein
MTIVQERTKARGGISSRLHIPDPNRTNHGNVDVHAEVHAQVNANVHAHENVHENVHE